jgi:hypothetical protein
MKLSRSNPPIETTRPNQANKHIFAKRLSAALISCMLLVGVTAPGSVHADEIWNHWKAAEALVAAGDQTAAVPHWVYLANHYADTGEWENAALFCGSWMLIMMRLAIMNRPFTIMSLKINTG